MSHGVLHLYHTVLMYYYRLLDVQCSDGRFEHELVIYMVFEYMEQDLDHFIHQARLDSKLAKVYYDCVNLIQSRCLRIEHHIFS